MDIRNIRAVHTRAREALSSASSDPKKIALWYTAACSAMALVLTVLTGILTDRIADTGGLSNIGLRSILSTGQSILPIVQLVLTACLGLGYAMAVLRLSRGEPAEPRTLLEGFRSIGPMLRATVFQGLIYLSQGFLSMYVSAFVFMATPYAAPFMEVMEPVLNAASVLNGELVVDDATLMAAADTMVPMLWIMLGIFLLLFLPTYYSYRMTTFCIADDPRRGALASMLRSKVLMRRNRIALLKLDLSMWWFYALQLLISLVCYGDLILAMLGIELPVSATASYYGFFVLSLIIQIVTYYFLMNRVNVAYAVAYDALQEAEGQSRQEKPNFPFPTQY